MTGSMIVKKPSFYSRLSTLFLIQIVFVFIVLALVLFYPEHDADIDTDLSLLRQEVLGLGLQAASTGITEYSIPVAGPGKTAAEELRSVLHGRKRFHSAYIYGASDSGGPSLLFSYDQGQSEYGMHGEVSAEPERTAVDIEIVRHALQENPGFMLSSIVDADHSVYYYSFGSPDGKPVVLAAVLDHNLLISNRSYLKYFLLLMFLVSALLSLLTLYLVSNRVQNPLKQLLRGLEKTTEGELYYLIETTNDNELNRLVEAFNRMTKTLWSSHQDMKTYNERLNRINVSLIEVQSFLATLIDSSPFAVVAFSVDGQIMLFNHMASQVFGCEPHEMVGKQVKTLFAQPLDQSHQQSAADGEPGVEARCRRHDGTSFPAYVIPTPVQGREGETCAFLYIIRDISESAGFQEMMVRLDRYCTRGEMAGDIAHEINNYLAVLQGNLELLPVVLRQGNEEKIEKKLLLMRDTVGKVARFADGLMDVPQDRVTFEKADLNQLVENLLAFLKPQNRFDNVVLTAELSADLPLVEFDPAQLQQLLMNLVFNGADAMRDVAGEKKITVRTLPAGPDSCRVARVEVADSGPGVPEEKQAVLFTKRFTTKRKGHGIGLITCQRIIEAHGGTIGYRYDDGAVFQFEIPLSQKDCKSDAPALTANQLLC